MFLRFLQKTISFGVDETMEQSVVNRSKRINFYYLVLITVLTIYTLYSSIAGICPLNIFNVIALVIALGSFIFLSAGRQSNLSSMLVLLLSAFIFLNAYLYNIDVSPILVMAFFLLFPLATSFSNSIAP